MNIASTSPLKIQGGGQCDQYLTVTISTSCSSWYLIQNLPSSLYGVRTATIHKENCKQQRLIIKERLEIHRMKKFPADGCITTGIREATLKLKKNFGQLGNTSSHKGICSIQLRHWSTIMLLGEKLIMFPNLLFLFFLYLFIFFILCLSVYFINSKMSTILVAVKIRKSES